MPNEGNVFINEALNEGFKLYIENEKKEYSLDYNKFLCCIVRMLVIVYDKDVLVNAFHSNDVSSFDKELVRYGFSDVDVINFKTVCDKFYKFDLKQQSKAIKKKNKFFNLVQKYLIDMMKCKNNANSVNNEENNNFYDLLFTANSKDFYKKSTAVMLAYNPYEIDEYAKKQNLI